MKTTRSRLIASARENLSETETREWKKLEADQSRAWRDFWVRVLRRQGHSNAEIAKDFEIPESTVRSIARRR